MTSKQLFSLRHPFEEVFVWLALHEQETLDEVMDEDKTDEEKEREEKERKKKEEEDK